MEGQKKTIREVLFNEVTGAVALVSITIGVVNWVNNPINEVKNDVNNVETNVALIQKDIYTITSNHLTHIQKELEDKTVADKERDKSVIELGKKMERILTILEEK